MIFKRSLVQKILLGEKTQTRRVKPYRYGPGSTVCIQDRWNEPARARVEITRVYRQRLGEISPEEIKAEGFRTLEEFKAAWIEIYGAWQPDQTVWVYEFRLLPEPPEAQKPQRREGREDDPMKQHKGGRRCRSQDTRGS